MIKPDGMRIILLLIPAASMLAGLFIFFNPALVIEIQRKFYEKINWRIEPISMKKEIRNTRIMGLFLAVIGVLALLKIICAGLINIQ